MDSYEALKRNSSLDITRIIAVLAVISLHISADFVTEYDVFSKEFMVGAFFDSISRIGVPLFVMISGSLMLDENKNITIKSIFSKNIKTLFGLLIFWSVLYCVLYNIALPLIIGEPLNVSDIITSLTEGHYHIWYLYMIIGLYLATPFFRAFVKKENKQTVLLFIIIALVTQFTLPMLNGMTLIWEDMAYLTNFINQFDLGFLVDSLRII